MLYTVRYPNCEVCDMPLTIDPDHSECFERPCGVCDCPNADHWQTNDGRWSGCAGCTDCEGFVLSTED